MDAIILEYTIQVISGGLNIVTYNVYLTIFLITILPLKTGLPCYIGDNPQCLFIESTLVPSIVGTREMDTILLLILNRSTGDTK